MGRISAFTELTSLASDDYLVVLDSSANIAKKITIANAFGIADFGWTASGESWTYNAWDSTNKIGTITVPTDATTKYAKGMFIKITQSTGGTKYGKIVAVTSTTLKAYFGSYTLNNEAITSPQYSIGHQPFGLPETIRDYQYYRFRATRTTSQTPSAATFTKIQWNVEEEDPSSSYDASTNYRFTAPVSGIYNVTARASITSGTGNRFLMCLYKNGVIYNRGSDGTADATIGSAFADQVKLVAGDYIEMWVYSQNAVATEATSDIMAFAASLISGV